MTRAFSCVLVDLDGTITDSAPGITASLRYMYERLGRPVPSQKELLRWVGPPIMDSFRDLAGLTEIEAEAALAVYREHYLEYGAFDSVVYSGVADVLGAIQSAGIPLGLATSKPESTARVILDHFGLDHLFVEITGASDDEVRSAKADVVAEALLRLKRHGVDLSNTVMIGDREHDVEGAGEHGIPTIFVEWGYGAPHEAEGALAIARTPAELGRLVLEATSAA